MALKSKSWIVLGFKSFEDSTLGCFFLLEDNFTELDNLQQKFKHVTLLVSNK